MPDEITGSPASTLVAETPLQGETSTPSIEGGADEFSGLGGDFDDIQLVETPEPATETQATPASEAQPVTPAPEAEKPAPVQEPPKVEPAKPEAAPTAPSPPVEEQGGSLQEQLTTHRGALIDALASERFKLTPQEEEALENDAVAEFPKLMSRVYLETMTAVLNHIQNSVPLLIRHQMGVLANERMAEKRFFEQFKTIDRAKHAQDILQFAQTFRQQNPRIPEADLFALVGAAVMAKHGLPAQIQGNGAATPQPTPFVPARPGSTVRITPEEENPFAGLGRDFDD